MESQAQVSPTKLFVGFFDIMGFKELVARSTHQDVLEKLTAIKKFLSSYEELDSKELDGTAYPGSIIRHALFSDSILVVSNGDSAVHCEHLVTRCNHFLWHCINNKVPVKGALSYGQITADFDNSLFFGQPIIDAFLLQEELNMYGAVLDHAFEARIAEFGAQLPPSFHRRLFKYKAPLKSGRINHLTLKWLSAQVEMNRTYAESLYLSVSGRPRLYVDNTVEFVQWVEKKLQDEKKPLE